MSLNILYRSVCVPIKDYIKILGQLWARAGAPRGRAGGVSAISYL